MHKLNQPLIQFYQDVEAIQLNFRKKGAKDLELIQQILKPHTYILSQHETKWIAIIFGNQQVFPKNIQQLTKLFNFPTLLNAWMSEEKILNQYFGKQNIFKPYPKQCIVCLQRKNLKFLICCGINLCYKCQNGIKVKQCPYCRHPLESKGRKYFMTIQKLQLMLPDCMIVPDKMNGSTSGVSFQE